MRFPIRKQYDAMDCGPTCLQMIAEYYGQYYSLQTLREKSYLTRNGSSLKGISSAAKSIGFKTESVWMNCQHQSFMKINQILERTFPSNVFLSI
ncbi:Lactococcin-G-processing and transport ATP-binding protein LagD [Dorea longicatena]|nr:Lactococcin-G-processing and transport ATP-binding protein LagD [Dorea longicatena]